MPEATDAWAAAAGVNAADITIERLSPDTANMSFLERYEKLRRVEA